MPNSDVDRFVDALHRLERDRDVEPMVALFDADAELWKLDGRQAAQGVDGARQFWTDYRDVFDTVDSEFTSRTETADRAVLEWTSRTRLATGHDLTYRGVSVLDLGDGPLTGFRTYYDSSAFLDPA